MWLYEDDHVKLFQAKLQTAIKKFPVYHSLLERVFNLRGNCNLNMQHFFGKTF